MSGLSLSSTSYSLCECHWNYSLKIVVFLVFVFLFPFLHDPKSINGYVKKKCIVIFISKIIYYYAYKGYLNPLQIVKSNTMKTRQWISPPISKYKVLISSLSIYKPRPIKNFRNICYFSIEKNVLHLNQIHHVVAN